MVKISVVIPTYNEEKNIVGCLEGIKNQTIPKKDYEIIIVDAPSKDMTQELARKHGADRIIIQKSKGIGGARNDGFKVAKADIIATTDCDIGIPKDWLEKLLKIEGTPYAAVTGTLYPLEKDLESKITVYILDQWAKLFNMIGQPLLSGTSSGIKKDIFLELGGYRDDIQVNDDIELGFRMIKKGYKIKFDKSIIVGFSTRRFKKNGLLKTFWTYIKEGLRLVLFNKTKNVGYTKQEYK